MNARVRRLVGMVCTSAVLSAPLPAAAQGQPAVAAPADRWSFSLMPYFWLPGVDGTLSYGPPPRGGGGANIEVDAQSLLDNLTSALMLAGEARKGRWLIATDVIYLDFEKDTSAVKSVDLNLGSGPVNVSTANLNAGTESSLKGWLWTMAGGYAAVVDPRWSLDVIGGFRLLSIKVETDWQLTAAVTGTGPGGSTATFARSGSVSRSDDVWSGIVGMKGRVRFGASSWFANYYVDLGGNADTFTWQGVAGVGYAFKWGEVVLDYRYLYYNQGGEQMIDSLSFGGPGLGMNFRF